MYELQNINKDISDKFYKSIFKTMKKDNWHSIACLSIESAFHDMLPNFPKYELEKYVKVLLKPILETKKNNFIVRDFMDNKEKEEIYESTYGDLIDELLDSEPYLFTYNNYKNLSISNTTNALEGGVFSHMKNMISLHRGLSENLKLNLVDYYLVNYKKK